MSNDEVERFRAAKAFINETIVDALGVRAFLFPLKLERCSTRADLARLLPDYAKAIARFRGEAETGSSSNALRSSLSGRRCARLGSRSPPSMRAATRCDG